MPTVAGQATPAITLLARQRVTHQVHPYDVDPDTPNYGAAVADILGIAQTRVFKTLVTEVDGALSEHGTVYVSAGRRGLQVEIDPAELIRLTDAVTARIAG